MRGVSVSCLFPRVVFFAALLAVVCLGGSEAARISDVRETKHNLSVTGPGTVKATTETQVCVFCHTPHGAEDITPGAPLWNRKLSTATYTPYTSQSMQATGMGAGDPGNQPDGSSKLCLSCHDGTIAIGSVNVLNGQLMESPISMQGVGGGGEMPTGDGETTGFTRKLGTDLTNDHPISFTYDHALYLADGELRDPDVIGNDILDRTPGVRPTVPLESGKMQCISCHDPHIRDDDPAVGNIKFLRLNRTQLAAPTGGNFDENNDIVCLACHDKLGQAWAVSAHANQTVADEQYKDAAATQREFKTGIRVWEAACLNCHDTHTVQGARRLLREGTDDTNSPKQGGSSAIEETCYQCHRDWGDALNILNIGDNLSVPNIKSDFDNPNIRMPIASSEQPAGTEVHDINDADMTEDQGTLGKASAGGTLNNRHAECTDCHNPHRLIKNQVFNNTGASTSATHDHSSPHSNIASGALRGTFGVDPTYPTNYYSSTEFMTDPSDFNIKKGLGSQGGGESTDVNSTYVTREYQICLKCHSNYGYDTPPSLATYPNGTPSGTNGMTQFTNQAMEFQSPLSHQGEGTAANTGAHSNYATNNHRSWHPVMEATGRSSGVRDSSTAIFLSPWNSAMGSQTMYCTDCHGNATSTGTVVPTSGKPWGPHGSSNYFLLKGVWNPSVGSSQNGGTGSDALCFRCHNYDDYANPNNGSPNKSGFNGGGMGMCMGGFCCESTNLHIGHADRIGYMRCKWCHVMVPHGFKNKALLANRNDIGPEVGLSKGTYKSHPYTQEPYYYQTMVMIDNFVTSGNWQSGNCGGRMWMVSNCSSPPS